MNEDKKRELTKLYEENLNRFKARKDLQSKIEKEKDKEQANYSLNKKSIKKRKIKLIKSNTFLFILSKKHRYKEYKNNIEAFGYPLNLIPYKYRTLEICKLSIKKDPKSFNLNDIPLKFLNSNFYEFCIKCGVSLKKIPRKMIDLNLCKLFLENKGSLSEIPMDLVDLDLCYYAIKNNPNNVKYIPFGTYLIPENKKEQLYMFAFENGLSVLEMPKNYVTKKMYEKQVLKNPRSIFLFPEEVQDFSMWHLAVESGLPVDLIPKKYTNIYSEEFSINEKIYEEEIKKDPEFIFKIPEEKRNIKLWILASESGLSLSKIPERYIKYYIPEKVLENSIKEDYHIIDKIPKERLNSNLYEQAAKYGMPFSKLPKKFLNKEICLAYVNKNKKIDFYIPQEFIDKDFYEELVKLDADNLSLVPFDGEKEICMITKEMCIEYVRQKHTINLKLFPLRFLNPDLIKSIYEDAAGLSDILDGYLSMHDYYKLKSLDSSLQVGKYKELLQDFYQRKLIDDSLKIPGATKEEMQKVESSNSFKLLKDLDVSKIFCHGTQITDDDKEKIKQYIILAGSKIVAESPRINYLNKNSTDEEIKKVANNYKDRLHNIFSKDIDNSKKDELMEVIKLEIDDLLSELDDYKRDIFNRQLVVYLENGNIDYDKTFKIIKPKYPYADDDDFVMHTLKSIKNKDYLNSKYGI